MVFLPCFSSTIGSFSDPYWRCFSEIPFLAPAANRFAIAMLTTSAGAYWGRWGWLSKIKFKSWNFKKLTRLTSTASLKFGNRWWHRHLWTADTLLELWLLDHNRLACLASGYRLTTNTSNLAWGIESRVGGIEFAWGCAMELASQSAGRSDKHRRSGWTVLVRRVLDPCRSIWRHVSEGGALGRGRGGVRWPTSYSYTYRLLAPCNCKSWRQKSVRNHGNWLFVIKISLKLACWTTQIATARIKKLLIFMTECCTWLSRNDNDALLLINSTFYSEMQCANYCNYSKHARSSATFTNMFVKNVHKKITIAELCGNDQSSVDESNTWDIEMFWRRTRNMKTFDENFNRIWEFFRPNS